jgi:hypothetical protein
MEACLPINGVKEGDKRKPGQKFKIEIWEGESEENPREEAQEDVSFFHQSHLEKS